jgi:hypothetical protein
MRSSICVNEDVPEGNDGAIVSDFLREVGIQMGELRQSLPHDGKRALNGKAQHNIRLILGEVSAGSELLCEVRRLLYVVKILPSLNRLRKRPDTSFKP